MTEVDRKHVMELLDNWSRWMRGSLGGGAARISLYMSPEEKAQEGRTVRPAMINEPNAHRVDALIAAIRINDGTKFFAELLDKHYVKLMDPRITCKRLRICNYDYDQHVTQAQSHFWELWQRLYNVPTKQIRLLAVNNQLTTRNPEPNLGLNNLTPLRRVTTHVRVPCYA